MEKETLMECINMGKPAEYTYDKDAEALQIKALELEDLGFKELAKKDVRRSRSQSKIGENKRI